MAVVKIETPRTRRLFGLLMKLQIDEGLQVKKLTARAFNQIKTMAWRENMSLLRSDLGGGVIWITVKPKPHSRLPNYHAAPAPALESVSVEGEGERYAAAVRKYCDRRRILIPKLSVLLEIARRIGYVRASSGDFEEWLKTGGAV